VHKHLIVLALLAAGCATLIWFFPFLGAIVTVAVAAGVFISYLMFIFGGYLRARTDETYGEEKKMWGFWD
jgi:hypothetical protein